MNGIIGGVLRCQRWFIRSLAWFSTHVCTQGGIVTSVHNYIEDNAIDTSKRYVPRQGMRAKLANAVYHEATDCDTGHRWLYLTGTVTTIGIGHYYGYMHTVVYRILLTCSDLH